MGLIQLLLIGDHGIYHLTTGYRISPRAHLDRRAPRTSTGDEKRERKKQVKTCVRLQGQDTKEEGREREEKGKITKNQRPAVGKTKMMK